MNSTASAISAACCGVSERTSDQISSLATRFPAVEDASQLAARSFTRILILLGLIMSFTSSAAAQMMLPATDVLAGDLQAVLDRFPKDQIVDEPVRIVDVGGYKMGVYIAYRPKNLPGQPAVIHNTKITEIYYMMTGAATLVTGGTVIEPGPLSSGAIPTLQGVRIEGGVSRKIAKGDVVIIPGGVSHWWSALETDITYLIVRPDPEGKQALK